MLGLVSLGDVERYGLRAAASRPGRAPTSRPSDASLTRRSRWRSRQKPLEPFTLDQGDVRKSGKAYPGHDGRLHGRPAAQPRQEDAAKVAQFIRVSTTEGQEPGSGNGELPAGFVPIKDQGATAKLYASAQEVADRRREADAGADRGAVDHDTARRPGGRRHRRHRRPRRLPTADGPQRGAVARAPAAAPSASPRPRRSRCRRDPGGELRAGRGLLPALLVFGLIGIAVASAVRFFVRPPPGPRHDRDHARPRDGRGPAARCPRPATAGDVAGATAEAPARAPRRPPTRRRPRSRCSPRRARWSRSSACGSWSRCCCWAGCPRTAPRTCSTPVPHGARRRPPRRSGRPSPVGEPVALLSIPRLGISQVVVEGTASGDTLAGPGHLRDTVLPGQVGTSVVYGRAATYGAPVRRTRPS